MKSKNETVVETKRKDYLIIDSKFTQLLPEVSFSKTEEQHLAERYRKEGVTIYVWREKNIVLEGYDCLAICRKYNIHYQIKYVSLNTRDDAKRWVIDTAFMRVNLSMWYRAKLVIQYWKPVFEKQAKENQKLSKGRGIKGRKKSANGFEQIDVNQQLADKAKVSRDTIVKVSYILNNIRHARRGLLQELDTEQISINRARVNVWRKKKTDRKKEKGAIRLSYINDLSKGIDNQVLCMDAEKGVNLIPDKSLTLCITSPPFSKDKNYHEVVDSATWEKNMALMRRVFKALKPKFRENGRCFIEFQPIRTREKADQAKEYNRPVHLHIINMMQELGYTYRGDIIWLKGRVGNNPLGPDCDCSPTSPRIRDAHSYIFVFYVGDWTLPCTDSSSELPHDKFDQNTKSVWDIPPETHGYGSHDCPFPVELPKRIIETFSFKNDLVCDVFGGSGTTAVAALQAGRRFVSIDLSKTSSAEAKQRIEEEMMKINDGKNKAA